MIMNFVSLTCCWSVLSPCLLALLVLHVGQVPVVALRCYSCLYAADDKSGVILTSLFTAVTQGGSDQGSPGGPPGGPPPPLEQQASCVDPFDVSQATTKDNCQTCIKIRLANSVSDDDHAYARICSEKTSYAKCHEEDNNSVVCGCHTDLCNGGNSPLTSHHVSHSVLWTALTVLLNTLLLPRLP